MEGVHGLSCLAPYLSEVPVPPFWCALVLVPLLEHMLVWLCCAVPGRGALSSPASLPHGAGVGQQGLC